MTCISAPGKVLIAGGYLVLDPVYSGVVVSTSSRFYTHVEDPAPPTSGRIHVRSPQFSGAAWEYSIAFNDASVGVREVLDGSLPTRNKFIYLALQRTLSLTAEIKGAEAISAIAKGLRITIVGDNDFYSQRAQLAESGLAPTFASVAQIQPFAHTGVRIADVHKTGLGSSAALITSLVSALLVHTGIVPRADFEDDTISDGRRLAHNVAQYVHCLAQGKIGSGFDVSAAVFGSQIYNKFDPAVLQPLMLDELPPTLLLLPVLAAKNDAWRGQVRPFQLPPCTRLVLADVDSGSDTPSLVGKVLKWRQQDSETANALWTELDQRNTSLAFALLELGKVASQGLTDYNTVMKRFSETTRSEWEKMSGNLARELLAVRDLSEHIRCKMREMGQLSGVPIEPPEQTRLLDACLSKPGIIAGGVPGAGGYDAIWLLVCDPPNFSQAEHPLTAIEELWGSWKEQTVTPLSAAESVAKGCRLENVASVRGLREAATA